MSTRRTKKKDERLMSSASSSSAPPPPSRPGRGGGGITKAVGIVSLGWCALSVALYRNGLHVFGFGAGYTAAVGMCVCAASSTKLNYVSLLGKDASSGKLGALQSVFFCQYIYLVRRWATLKRQLRKEDRWNLIVDVKATHTGPKLTALTASGGAAVADENDADMLFSRRRIFLGCWPEKGVTDLPIPVNDGSLLDIATSLAVVDVTCELPRTHSKLPYFCVPTWDTRGPDTSKMADAARWAFRQMDDGNDVYVHCAHGHGRSAALVAAMLVELGLVKDVQAAVAHLKMRRPRVKMNAEQIYAAEKCVSVLANL